MNKFIFSILFLLLIGIISNANANEVAIKNITSATYLIATTDNYGNLYLYYYNKDSTNQFLGIEGFNTKGECFIDTYNENGLCKNPNNAVVNK